jgi:3D (Asp-Asp-Asp) domain-containing protein
MILDILDYRERMKYYAVVSICLLSINTMLLIGILWKAKTATEVLVRQTALMEQEKVSQETVEDPKPEEQSSQKMYFERITSIKATVTAYTAHRKETGGVPRRTAIMEKPVPGWTCAVSRDLSHWLGGRVWIEGIGVRRVNDVMNNRFSHRVDVLVGNSSEAAQIAAGWKQVVYLGRDQG